MKKDLQMVYLQCTHRGARGWLWDFRCLQLKERIRLLLTPSLIVLCTENPAAQTSASAGTSALCSLLMLLVLIEETDMP